MALEPLTIRDNNSGAEARVLPGLGFNCFSFVVPVKSKSDAEEPKSLEVLWSSPDLLTGKARPSGSGIPLMFPFAGRIRGAVYEFEGTKYQLEAGDGQGNAIHGFVISRPWRVIKHESDRVVGQFQASVDDPTILPHWPADFRITCEYRVEGNTLVGDYTIENPDSKPLPFGFGTHAYFRLPLGGESAEDCVARVPASENWELVKLLPTGRTTRSPEAAALSKGMPARDMKFDHVFGGLSADNHRTTTSVHDPKSGHTVVQTFDDQFPICVVYNPPHREAVCMEPYTTVPDAFTMATQGVKTHLLVLAPGQSFRTRIDIRLN